MKDSAAIALIIFLCALVVLMVYQGNRFVDDEIKHEELMKEINSRPIMTWCRHCKYVGYEQDFKRTCPRCGQN